jgi:hypothetical protein
MEKKMSAEINIIDPEQPMHILSAGPSSRSETLRAVSADLPGYSGGSWGLPLPGTLVIAALRTIQEPDDKGNPRGERDG